MRTTSAVLAAVLTAGTVAAVLPGGQAAAQAPRPTYGATGHFHVVEHAVTDTVVDLGPAGDSRGDLLTFANPVYNGANTRRVGHDEGSCVRTAAGRSWECEWTLRLPRGHLVVEGPFFDDRDSTLAIIGGTGIWAHARGQMRLHARNAAGTRFDFRYDVRR